MLSDRELFESLDLDLPELAAVKKTVTEGDTEKAKQALGTHIREREALKWLTPVSERPQPGKSAGDFPEALKLLDHEFTYGFHGAPSYTAQFGETIDWTANPSEGEYKTHLWNESLNRHFHFAKLVDAYWGTGDSRFVEGLVRDWLDWIEHNPRPEDSGNSVEWPYGCYAWQTLTTAIRLERSWPVALYKCIDQPAFTDEALCAIAGSYCDQARHLFAWPTGHNWLTEECMGLYTAGVLFPEFKEAENWRKTAIARLHKQLTDEVYPDGAEYELAGGYGNWVVRNMAYLLEYAEMAGRADEVPDDFKAHTEKMFDYLLSVAMPDGRMPGLNDSGNADVTDLLRIGHELFPHRDDFEYVASRRERGRVPTFTSRGLPWSGHYVMRTGWGEDDLFMLVDSGPYGSAHQHEDKLHFVLFGYGRQLILDPGNYSYDASRWRQYVLTTPGHNTVMVDSMGQRRRGQRETFFWKRPWLDEAPPENDTLWVSESDFDFVRGTYRDGYGKRNDQKARETGRPESDDYELIHAATHTRRVLFLKPDYWLIVDTLVPSDSEEHTYETLFHFDAEEAITDDATRSVATASADAANVTVLPMASDRLKLTVVKGEDDPVQGWGNDPWRPVPAAVYSTSGRGTIWMAYAVVPTRAGEDSSITSVEWIGDDEETLALAVNFADGRKDLIHIAHKNKAEKAFGVYTSDAEAAVVRLNAAGSTTGTFAIGGTLKNLTSKEKSDGLVHFGTIRKST